MMFKRSQRAFILIGWLLVMAAGVWLWASSDRSGAEAEVDASEAESQLSAPQDPGTTPVETDEHSAEEDVIEELAAQVVAFEIAFHETSWRDAPEDRLDKIEPFLHPGATLTSEVDLVSGHPDAGRMRVTATLTADEVDDPWLFDPDTAYVTATVTKTVTNEVGEPVNSFKEMTERVWVNTAEGWRVFSNGETIPVDQATP